MLLPWREGRLRAPRAGPWASNGVTVLGIHGRVCTKKPLDSAKHLAARPEIANLEKDKVRKPALCTLRICNTPALRGLENSGSVMMMSVRSKL